MGHLYWRKVGGVKVVMRDGQIERIGLHGNDDVGRERGEGIIFVFLAVAGRRSEAEAES